VPSIISASELRAVLGVSSALYNDAYLEGIIDTAENTILPMLVTFKSAVQKTVLTDNVATFTTVGEHEFTEGQSVVIAGCLSPYNGTRTVLADNLTATTFSASITNADVLEANVIPSGTATLTGASTYVGNQSVRSAVFAIQLKYFNQELQPVDKLKALTLQLLHTEWVAVYIQE